MSSRVRTRSELSSPLSRVRTPCLPCTASCMVVRTGSRQLHGSARYRWRVSSAGPSTAPVARLPAQQRSAAGGLVRAPRKARRLLRTAMWPKPGRAAGALPVAPHAARAQMLSIVYAQELPGREDSAGAADLWRGRRLGRPGLVRPRHRPRRAGRPPRARSRCIWWNGMHALRCAASGGPWLHAAQGWPVRCGLFGGNALRPGLCRPHRAGRRLPLV